jgi:hypothetical protein
MLSAASLFTVRNYSANENTATMVFPLKNGSSDIVAESWNGELRAMPEIIVNGISVYYERNGHGEPLV